MKTQASPGVYSETVKSLWLRSAVLSKSLDNSLGAIHGIGLTEYMVLDNLVSAPNQMLRRIDIAEQMARTASGITRLLMPMEKIGLVKKQSSARDARVSMVQLTAAGAEVYENASVTLENKAKASLERLGEKEVAKLLALLQAL